MPRSSPELPEPQYPTHQETFRPDGWDIDITVAYDEDGNPFWPVRILCVWLGIDRPSAIRKLRSHRKLSKQLRYYWLKTSGGTKPTWCIDERFIGYWFGYIDDPRVREDIFEKLEEFQDKIAAYAHFLLLGPDRLAMHVMTMEELTQKLMDVLREMKRMGTDVNSLKFIIRHLDSRIGQIESQAFLALEQDTGENGDA